MLDASLEVRSAVVYASLIVILVFVPVFFLEGLSGSFFRPLALAYVLAIVASLLVALTVTPALSLMLLTGATERRRESPLVPGAQGDAIARSCRRSRGGRAGRSASWSPPSRRAAAAVAGLGEEFLPELPGERLPDALGREARDVARSHAADHRATSARSCVAVPGVRNFGSHIGRAEVADEVVGPNFTELWISVDPKADHAKTSWPRSRRSSTATPASTSDVLTYLKERIKEVLTGAGATVVVRIFGPDMTVLRAKAHEVDKVMEDVEGVTNLKVEPQIVVPQLDVRLRPDASARLGLTPGDVRRAATTLVKGPRSARSTATRRSSTSSSGGSEERPQRRRRAQRPADRDAAGHARAALATWPTIAIVPAPNEIKREGASRRIDVTCNVQGRDLGSVATRDRGRRSRSSSSSASTTPSSSANTPRARSRGSGCWPWRRCRCWASC